MRAMPAVVPFWCEDSGRNGELTTIASNEDVRGALSMPYTFVPLYICKTRAIG